MSATWFTARQIAELRLPGVPETERGVRKRAAGDDWAFRDRDASGGGREYPVTALPAEARAELLRAAALAGNARERALLEERAAALAGKN